MVGDDANGDALRSKVSKLFSAVGEMRVLQIHMRCVSFAGLVGGGGRAGGCMSQLLGGDGTPRGMGESRLLASS